MQTDSSPEGPGEPEVFHPYDIVEKFTEFVEPGPEPGITPVRHDIFVPMLDRRYTAASGGYDIVVPGKCSDEMIRQRTRLVPEPVVEKRLTAACLLFGIDHLASDGFKYVEYRHRRIGVEIIDITWNEQGDLHTDGTPSLFQNFQV